MKCGKTGCSREALYALALNFPATGVPIDLHQPLKMLIGLALCTPHYEEIEAEKMLTPEIKSIVQTVLIGAVAPDFERVYKSKVKLDSAEFKSFNELRSRK